MALNRSPEFCLKLTYRNLLKANHVPGDTWGKPFLVPRALFEQTWKRSTRSCYNPNMKALSLMVSDKKIFSCFPYLGLSFIRYRIFD